MADPSTYRPAPGSIPLEPGVYRFSDAHGRVIYVGKAKSLRQRLNSYFADLSNLHPRTQAMVTTAARVDWTVVQNEVEALGLEYTWIKEYAPRFNVMYRDDKSYPWLAVTWSEEYPRVFVGRGKKRRGWRYFGPYGHAWAIRETVDTLLRVFPMRSCTAGTFRAARAAGRPCLLGYIGKCVAPCVDRVTAEEHRAVADDFCQFMAGRSTGLVRRLEREMAEAAGNLEFERAGVLRDDIAALNLAMEKNAIVLGDGTDTDVIAMVAEELEVSVMVFHVRGGRVRGRRGWVADRTADQTEPELVGSFLTQLYGAAGELEVTDGEVNGEARPIPREVLVPVLPDDAEVYTDWLSERRGSRVSLRVPQRGDKRTLMDTVTRNAEEALARHRTKRSVDLTARTRALEEIQEALSLPTPPLRIECYDISNLQGTNVVASMVVFEDGMSRKSEYRRFTIKGVEGQNDVASMYEVITRRFSRMLQEQELLTGEGDGPSLVDPTTGKPLRFAYAPSLVVVDGGPPQVEAARRALDDLGITDVGLCGLAKRLEEVWLPEEDYPVILPRTSEGLYLMQRVRDEAHRFAITHHRTRRSRSMLESMLDDIQGLGPGRRATLMKEFGSVKRLRTATEDEIRALPGFGPATARAVVAAVGAAPAREVLNTATGEITEE
ncbi:excinuclease ABC subunit UvrC [Raineyella sp. LH-20]|uniref:excinuclease ABC subunit UvrC n=1 Tax=Raineyella sp. LH-20 TaxID=3081204 RepID=UPI002954F79F|nr:excinuclease ABC subunit UvrC [Raineyella sp. LH-20]WOP17672.1 excinuclease ABC subunit UvrC [Raineyella sp. LH-20]